MTDEDLKELKAAARKAAFARRKAAHVALGAQVDAATRRLLDAIGPAEGRVVSGYMAMRTEIDPGPAMTALHAAGARVCVPVIAGAGLPLKFREWAPEAPMVDGPFGAQVPASGDWLEPEILIAPLVAFTRDGWRLGYGGGFYDRTLAKLRATRPTRAVGFAYAAQEADMLPVEPTDVPLDAIVTERETITPAAGGRA